MDQKTYLITGATGNTGSKTVRLLLDKGPERAPRPGPRQLRMMAGPSTEQSFIALSHAFAEGGGLGQT